MAYPGSFNVSPARLLAIIGVGAIVLASAAPLTATDEKLALLFVSFGDVEACSCIDSYWPRALAELVNYEVPVFHPLKPTMGKLVWKAARNQTWEQYKAISPSCNTSFQVNARAQAAAVNTALEQRRGLKSAVYVGYNFVAGDGCPSGVTVVEQLQQAASDGATKVVLINQNGAQFSKTSIGVSYDQVTPLLRGGTWNKAVKVVGLDDYSNSSDFEQLQASFIEAQLSKLLPGAAPSDTCVMLAAHGNPARVSKAGDPYEKLVRNNYASLAARLSRQGYRPFLAFQNHGGKGQKFPQNLFPWSSPPDTDVAPQIAKENCTNVLVSGVLSFVVDNSETLFDENIDDRRMLIGKTVAVTPVFNADTGFAAFLSKAIANELNNRGPRLRELN